MNNRPKLVILDTMNFWMDSAWDILMDMIAKTDVITINDEEARQLSGEYSLVKAAKKIHTMGPEYVIIKKESTELCFSMIIKYLLSRTSTGRCFRSDRSWRYFCRRFRGISCQKGKIDFETMKSALIVGSAMASFTVEKFGTERIEEVNEADMFSRLRQFKELTTFDVELQ